MLRLHVARKVSQLFSQPLPAPCLRSIACTFSPSGATSSSHSSNPGSRRSYTNLWRRSSSLTRRFKREAIQPVQYLGIRYAQSASNSRWLSRQKGDRFAREAKVANLKSRAAFKLLQINDRYRIFRPGQTVVDLGFAPGSWSQVAIDLVRPGVGRVVGVDIIPVTPPKGVNGIQGNFLSYDTQERVRDLLRDENRGRAKRDIMIDPVDMTQVDEGYIEQAGRESTDTDDATQQDWECVDVVLSDMSEPWEITSGLWKNSLSNPYYRLMNTTGNRFKDHAGSMDLCRAALYFAFDTLKTGGHFVCKFYQGAEDKQFEKQLKAMFQKVHREKPESSRTESKESFFIGMKKLATLDRNAIFDEGT